MQSNESKKDGVEKADSEATSNELLSDIEESEAEVDSGSSASDPGPSPDGAREGGGMKDEG